MRIKLMILAVMLGELGLAYVARPAGGQTWDGPKLKPVSRQEVFEFAQPPTFKEAVDAKGRPIKDRYEISFASKGYCDVAVAIHDASGKLVRHVVYGVLGPNAPAPLAANHLAQKIIWDGKDDFGKYVPDPAVCKARVSLGLRPTFDKIIAWHPKDSCSTGSRISGLGAGPDGVFVATFTRGYWAGLRVFDHDGNYLRTLWPFRADKWPTMSRSGLARQVLPGEPGDVPARDGFGQFAPFKVDAESIKLVQANGCVVWPMGNYGIRSGLYRIGVDGSADLPILGPPIASDKDTGRMAGIYSIAPSPDGRWIYVTRLYAEVPAVSPYGPYKVQRGIGMPNRRHAVFRLAWDGKEPINTESFVGEVTAGNTDKGADKDNAHLSNPEDVATDSAGRVYVADCGNNRIQVFNPDGKYLATIPVETPHKLGVHHKTGEIYVMSYPWTPASRAWLCKFSALPDCRLLAKTEVRLDAALTVSGGARDDAWGVFRPNAGLFDRACFALDSWAEPAQAWIAVGFQITRWADRGDKFELVEDFDQTIRRDGYTPHAFAAYKRQRIGADPVRGHLFYHGYSLAMSHCLYRCDPEVGKGWERIGTPLTVDDFQVGQDGLLYVRDIKAVVRLDPDSVRAGGAGELYYDRELPFDYGEELPNGLDGIAVSGPDRRLRGAVRLPALVPGHYFNMGFAVNHLGHFVALCINYHHQQRSVNHPNLDGRMWADLPSDRFRPPIFPGRVWSVASLVFVYDDRGQEIGQDVVKAVNYKSSGIKLDGADNVYIGVAAYPMIDGKPLAAVCGDTGPGAMLKFPRTGGKIFGEWGEPAKLEEKDRPNRPAEFSADGAKLWTQNMLWSYPGLSSQPVAGSCPCPASRFDVDVYGRCFVPESWRFSVGVCDTNGNPICHIGRYGNADSGRGPDSPVPVVGDIAFSNCDFLCTVSDKWLYVHDAGNWRIVRIKLGYHAEQMLPLH